MLVILHRSVESSKVSLQKRFYNKGHLKIGNRGSEGFWSRCFQRFYITQSKSSNNGDLQPKIEPMMLFLWSNSESYGFQVRQLIGSIASSLSLGGS